MRATGKIQIEEIEQEHETTILDNPTVEVTAVYLECLFTSSDGKQLSRLKKIEVNKDSAILKTAMRKHKLLKQFKYE